jgi:hypothetical protein
VEDTVAEISVHKAGTIKASDAMKDAVKERVCVKDGRTKRDVSPKFSLPKKGCLAVKVSLLEGYVSNEVNADKGSTTSERCTLKRGIALNLDS